MITAPMFESLRARAHGTAGEMVIITNGRDKVPVAQIVALEVAKERPFDLFYNPNFEIPADFDELSPEELNLWNGGGDDGLLD
jgi:antitoxin (DNA-binding transcriptional repressor) of toxin-antitoxin stability system